MTNALVAWFMDQCAGLTDRQWRSGAYDAIVWARTVEVGCSLEEADVWLAEELQERYASQG